MDDIKGKIVNHLSLLEHRIKNIRTRKLLKSSWQEDSILRFQLIDYKRDQKMYMIALNKLENK
jgi:hypothetical protein